jgi:hypothetical protein
LHLPEPRTGDETHDETRPRPSPDRGGDAARPCAGDSYEPGFGLD